jgi:hypothetical protein
MSGQESKNSAKDNTQSSAVAEPKNTTIKFTGIASAYNEDGVATTDSNFVMANYANATVTHLKKFNDHALFESATSNLSINYQGGYNGNDAKMENSTRKEGHLQNVTAEYSTTLALKTDVYDTIESANITIGNFTNPFLDMLNEGHGDSLNKDDRQNSEAGEIRRRVMKTGTTDIRTSNIGIDTTIKGVKIMYSNNLQNDDNKSLESYGFNWTNNLDNLSTDKFIKVKNIGIMRAKDQKKYEGYTVNTTVAEKVDFGFTIAKNKTDKNNDGQIFNLGYKFMDKYKFNMYFGEADPEEFDQLGFTITELDSDLSIGYYKQSTTASGIKTDKEGYGISSKNTFERSF